jgi:hypothetical protein
MNAKSKKTLKAAALAAGLVAVLLPTGCAEESSQSGMERAPGTPDTVVAPPTAE